jgi:hypothetical protein
MKKLLILPLLALTLFSCGSDSEEDFKALSQDACDCVNESTKELSPEMIKVLADSEGDQAKMEKLMGDYAEANPMQAMQDATLMQGEMINNMTTCLDGVQKKYADSFDGMTDKEVQEKMMEQLKGMEDCKSSYTLVKMAIGL